MIDPSRSTPPDAKRKAVPSVSQNRALAGYLVPHCAQTFSVWPGAGCVGVEGETSMDREYRPRGNRWSMNCTTLCPNDLGHLLSTFIPACGPIASRSSAY